MQMAINDLLSSFSSVVVDCVGSVFSSICPPPFPPTKRRAILVSFNPSMYPTSTANPNRVGCGGGKQLKRLSTERQMHRYPTAKPIAKWSGAAVCSLLRRCVSPHRTEKQRSCFHRGATRGSATCCVNSCYSYRTKKWRSCFHRGVYGWYSILSQTTI